MIFNTKIRNPNKAELEQAYQKLSDMYQELYEEKQSEIDLKDQEIKKLSSKARQWMRRYHQLEVSTREDSVDVSDIDSKDQEYIQQLQDIVAEMSIKNDRLERRIAKQRLALQNKPETVSDQPKVIEMPQSQSKDKPSKESVKEKVMKAVTPKEKEEVELKFSPKFQAILERHAHECNG